MATLYALEFVGAKDGTVTPPLKLDGGLVSAKERRTRATKPNAILNPGDLVFIGTLPQGASMRAIACNFDTSLGATTLSVGPLANPTKYVNGKTNTNTDTPTSIGPRAAAVVTPPLLADEDLYVTIGTAAIPAAVVGAFETTYTITT